MIVLGIDPGYAIVGWGVISYDKYKFTTVGYGAITTEAHTAFSDRLLEIYKDMQTVLSKFNIDAVSMEKLYFNQNTTTAIDVAQARGVILLACREKGIPVYEYTPLQVKQAITGYGRAPKKQIMEMTKNFLKLEKVPKPDDTADALAMAVCHCHNASSFGIKTLGGKK